MANRRVNSRLLSLMGGLLVLVALLGLGAAQQVGAQAGPAESEWVSVVNFGGSDKLMVQNDAGLSYKVQYLGIRGPVRSSIVHSGAGAFHGQLVLGKRVFLESDGRNEDAGYKLRHAYLEGDPVPIGAKMVAAGWALAVPYPVDHRHRDLFLQLQEQAMAQQANLWMPGVFGPAAPWRPAGSTAVGYIPADPDLNPALDLLNSVPTGQSIINRLVRTAPPIAFRDLPEAVGGYAHPLGHFVVMSRKVGVADPRSLAAALAHEGTHTVDFTTGELQLTDFGCFELEQRSHGIQAQVWAEFFGPNGKPEPQDDWDRSNNAVLRFAQRGDLENYVRRSPGYEAQCVRERIGG